MLKGLKRVWNLFTTIMLVLIVILAILLVGVRLFGFQPYTVLSGSMEPEYHVGSVIYVKKVDPLTLKERDPVTFMLNETTVATHRIIEVIPDEEDPTVVRFRTKGDNNEIADGELLHSSNVIGKPVFTVPYLGYLATFIQNSPGRYIAMGFCILMLLSVMLPTATAKKPKETEEQIPIEEEKEEAPAASPEQENACEDSVPIAQAKEDAPASQEPPEPQEPPKSE